MYNQFNKFSIGDSIRIDMPIQWYDIYLPSGSEVEVVTIQGLNNSNITNRKRWQYGIKSKLINTIIYVDPDILSGVLLIGSYNEPKIYIVRSNDPLSSVDVFRTPQNAMKYFEDCMVSPMHFGAIITVESKRFSD